MNALLATNIDNPQTTPGSSGVHTVRLAIDENVSNWSSTPTAHVRDLVAAGIKPAGLAVYFAIADRMMTSKGQYFRSNEKLAEECGMSVSWTKKCISRLKKSGFLSVWYVKGGRRMRVLTKGSHSSPPGILYDTPRDPIGATDKENKIKKTLQPSSCVFSASLSLQERKDRVLWGGALERLAATHGQEAVMRGLSVFDSHDPKTIDNPVGFLTRAIKEKWKPIKKKKKKQDEPVYWNESEYMKANR